MFPKNDADLDHRVDQDTGGEDLKETAPEADDDVDEASDAFLVTRRITVIVQTKDARIASILAASLLVLGKPDQSEGNNRQQEALPVHRDVQALHVPLFSCR